MKELVSFFIFVSYRLLGNLKVMVLGKLSSKLEDLKRVEGRMHKRRSNAAIFTSHWLQCPKKYEYLIEYAITLWGVSCPARMCCFQGSKSTKIQLKMYKGQTVTTNQGLLQRSFNCLAIHISKLTVAPPNLISVRGQFYEGNSFQSLTTSSVNLHIINSQNKCILLH